MEIIINIDEDTYRYIQSRCKYQNKGDKGLSKFEKVGVAIKNGSPLPKGHGRLKDVDAFLSKVKADREHSVYVTSWTADDVLNVLNNSYTPTIIPADKTESEE